MTIILVHGRSQQGKDPIELETLWEDSLVAGVALAGGTPPAAEQMVFPFYGYLYEGYALAARQPETPAAQADFAQFKAEYADALRGRYPKPRRAASKKVARTAAAREQAALAFYDPIVELLERIPGVSRTIIARHLRDVHDYLSNKDGLREQTMDLIAKPIVANQGDRILLVAHSLGTIVTYDILNSRPDLKVDTYLTLGSPLGIDNAVRRRLLPDAEGRRDVPAGVANWVNVADPDDIVALDDKLANDFRRGGKSVIRDLRVKNPKNLGGPHGIAGYLRQKQVGQVVSDALK